MALPSYQAYEPIILTVASSTQALSFNRSDLSNTITLTQTSANVLTLSGGLGIASLTPGVTTDVLYQNSHILYWNGSPISSPSYLATIGDGITTAFTITHNLGTTDVQVVCWELAGLYRQITNLDIRCISTTQVSINFITAPASGAIRVMVYTMGANIIAPMTNPMTTAGDMIYGGTAGAATRFAGNATATKQFLSMTSAVPSFATIASADITTALTTPGPIGGTTPNTGAFTTLNLINAASPTFTMKGYGAANGFNISIDSSKNVTINNNETGTLTLAANGGAICIAMTTTGVTIQNYPLNILANYGITITSGTPIAGTATTLYQISNILYFNGYPVGLTPAISAPSWASTMTLTTNIYNVIRITLGGSPTTLNFSAGNDGQKILLELKQDGTGTRLVTWGTGVVFGTDITSAMLILTTTINKTDEITLVYNSAASAWRIIGFARGY